jgi:CheY-like chemotaxis protein
MTRTSFEPTGKAILIVEDNRVSRELLETILKPHDYDLFFAENGREAIEIATQEHLALILMDLKLPGMSGHEVVELLKSKPETAEIPIVALTAHAVGSERQRAADAGCAGYITKPIDTRAFASQLKQYMR